MTDIDAQRDAAWADLRAGREARPIVCDHVTCIRKKCKCPCHKSKVEHPTPSPVVRYHAEVTPVLSTVNRAAELLDVIRKLLPEVVRRANDDSDDGYKEASGGPAVSGGSDNPDLFTQAFRPIGQGENTKWIAKTDRVRTSYATLTISLRDANKLIAAAYNEIASLQALTEEEARKLLDDTDVASCKNCSRPVANSGTDWLRSGRCSACNWYFTMHGIERPKDLWNR